MINEKFSRWLGVCFLVTLFASIIVLPQVAEADVYVSHIEVRILRVQCDNGVLRHYLQSYTKTWTNHTFTGSHQHPSPTVNVIYTDVECTVEGCYNCS